MDAKKTGKIAMSLVVENDQSFGLRQYQDELQLIQNELNGVIGRLVVTLNTHYLFVEIDEEGGDDSFWGVELDQLKDVGTSLYQLRRRLANNDLYIPQDDVGEAA